MAPVARRKKNEEDVVHMKGTIYDKIVKWVPNKFRQQIRQNPKKVPTESKTSSENKIKKSNHGVPENSEKDRTSSENDPKQLRKCPEAVPEVVYGWYKYKLI